MDKIFKFRNDPARRNFTSNIETSREVEDVRTARKQVIVGILRSLVEYARVENPQLILSKKTIEQLIRENRTSFPPELGVITITSLIGLFDSLNHLKSKLE